MQTELSKTSLVLRCDCHAIDFEFVEPLTDASILRCTECERVFVMGELRDRLALELVDPAAALAADDIAAELRERDIRVAGSRVVDSRWPAMK